MRGETILVVDDEKLIRWTLKQELTKVGFNIVEAESAKDATRFLEEQEPDLMILDQLLPDGTGIDILNNIKQMNVAVPIIMLTAVDRSDVAVRAMKLGAFDYVTKPVNIEELTIVVDKALEATRLRRQIAHYLKEQEKSFGFCGMIGSSPPMKKVFSDISKIAQSSRTTVLITGESGTGKELAAKALHFLGERRDAPLMTLNFSALTESLIESELFGHEKGAFTDARTQKQGIFELADGGTIFLDEIADISPKVQIRLLRVLEQKTFQRVGGTADITVDTRIIAATNKPLEEQIAENKFRADLYYRLNVANIHMPPVRDRGEDIIMLAEYFLQEFVTKYKKRFIGLSDRTKELFLQYNWPGNVREIRNILEHAVLLFDDVHLQPDHVNLVSGSTHASSLPQSEQHSSDLSLYDIEKDALLDALKKAGYNQSQAARMLKISRDTLRYRIKKYGLTDRP